MAQTRYKRKRKSNRESERDAWKKMIEAEAKMKVLKGAAEAFSKRTDVLRGLTALMTQGLYSAKLPAGQIREEVKEREAQRDLDRNAEFNQRMNNRREDKPI